MANGNRRIPRSDGALDVFIRTTTNVLLAPEQPYNWQRLGLTEDEKDGWKALHDEWVAVYARCSNANLRSKTAIAQKDDIRKRFTRYSYRILVRAQTLSGITEDDRAVFRIPKRKKTYTRRTAIDDAPLVQLQSMAGGWIRLRARVAGTEGRARIRPMADYLEVRYAVLPIGTTPPETWSQCLQFTVKTKAISILQLPLDQRGRVIYAFCRWTNLSEQSKSGPWCNRIEAIVA